MKNTKSPCTLLYSITGLFGSDLGIIQMVITRDQRYYFDTPLVEYEHHSLTRNAKQKNQEASKILRKIYNRFFSKKTYVYRGKIQ